MKHVPHLYLGSAWSESQLDVTEHQAGHLTRVLRAEAGSAVTYTNGVGLIGSGIWTGAGVERGDESVVVRPGQLVLAAAPPTNRDRARFLVEKLAELGVESLLWLRTEWGSRKAPPATRQSAWAISALEQSRGAWLMATSGDLVGWGDLEGPIVVCSPTGNVPTPGFVPRTVVVGPEGGLSPEEIPPDSEEFRVAETILRIETAAIVAAIIFK